MTVIIQSIVEDDETDVEEVVVDTAPVRFGGRFLKEDLLREIVEDRRGDSS